MFRALGHMPNPWEAIRCLVRRDPYASRGGCVLWVLQLFPTGGMQTTRFPIKADADDKEDELPKRERLANTMGGGRTTALQI